ncbi:hypothetical protein P171DRAFT_5922 [Karstenula rhodostoma CBS 690.94]|uniref:D-isomer specific 2-hydroxyacid dehydrogenase catalytic domain-containing protein n=1 Tax=Karstenula rhodostoma CBS 690.94 TaxID=1392251 RepID=A0A9P4PWC5_9PLEO|nr:hypothetical protein P171DRAFT_5922 [Karstenula rhodostoma CBS 690.94]
MLLGIYDQVDEELLAIACRQLDVIASIAVGAYHVDCALPKQGNIRLGYTPTCLTNAIAAISAMLILKVQEEPAELVAKQWPQIP